ncbi:MAG: carbohydrate ABC transporter permease [bacterium]
MRFRRFFEREMIVGYLFMLPVLAFFFTIMIYPLILGIRLSFFEHSLIYPIHNFIGLENYRELLGDESFWIALKNTVLWCVTIVICNFLVGLGLALLLNRDFKGRALVRAIWLLPWAVPTIVASLSWKWIYEPEAGVLNFLLKSANLIGKNLLYLTNASSAFPSVIVVAVWKAYPFMMMALLAGLQSIPHELYEASAVDGASGWQQFWHITLPLLAPLIGILTTLELIWNFNHFDIVYQLTQGGPGDATMLLSTIVYIRAFGGTRLGYGSAIAVVMLIFLLIFGYFYFRLYRRQGD